MKHLKINVQFNTFPSIYLNPKSNHHFFDPFTLVGTAISHVVTSSCKKGQGAKLKLEYLKVCMSSCVLLQVPLK